MLDSYLSFFYICSYLDFGSPDIAVGKLREFEIQDCIAFSGSPVYREPLFRTFIRRDCPLPGGSDFYLIRSFCDSSGYKARRHCE